jgi:hypothetical protein
MTDSATLDLMVAEWACERLINRFAQYNDQNDHDAIAGLFVEEGCFSRPLMPDDYQEGREAIRALFRDRQRRLGRHLVTSIVIDVTSPTTARGRSYLIYMSNADGSAPVPAQADPGVMVCQFDDEFVLTPEGWRFKLRRGSLILKS